MDEKRVEMTEIQFQKALREAHAAGRREGLEEAAKVVERESYATLSVPSGRHWWERDALKLFARDIRALADRDAGGGE